jgi:hypothetical protein
MKIDDILADDPPKTERELLYEEAHKKFVEKSKRISDMVLTVLQAQITVEGSMIEVLQAYGKDPKHFFLTGHKIKECKRLDPPGVGHGAWDLLTLCSHVRNELMHSLDDAAIKAKSDAVREAYLAVTENERQKQSIREMTDTQMVMSAIYHVGSLIVVATERLCEEKMA